MPNVYITATEHINKRPYPALIQAHLAVNFGPKGHAPFYEPFDSNSMQRSAITIAKMVELFTSKSSFIIVNDMDVIEILHQIDAYIAEVYPLKDRDEAVDKYIERILLLRDRIYFLFRRILNLHPQWKESYQDQVGVFSVMAELYRSIGVNIELPESLMEDLRMCPTIRHSAKTKAQEIRAKPIQHGPGIFDV